LSESPAKSAMLLIRRCFSSRDSDGTGTAYTRGRAGSVAAGLNLPAGLPI